MEVSSASRAAAKLLMSLHGGMRRTKVPKVIRLAIVSDLQNQKRHVESHATQEALRCKLCRMPCRLCPDLHRGLPAACLSFYNDVPSSLQPCVRRHVLRLND